MADAGPDSPPGLPLSRVVADLRSELLTAIANGEGGESKFRLKLAEVEFQLAVTRRDEGTAKAAFWVLEPGDPGRYDRATCQSLKLTLEPIGALRAVARVNLLLLRLLWIPVLWLLGVQFNHASASFDLSPLYLLVAGFLPLRYGRAGFWMVLLGAIPLLFGFNLGPISTAPQWGLYTACALLGWLVVSRPARDRLSSIVPRLGWFAALAVTVVGGLSLGFDLSPWSFGASFGLLLGFAYAVLGALGLGRRPALIGAIGGTLLMLPTLWLHWPDMSGIQVRYGVDCVSLLLLFFATRVQMRMLRRGEKGPSSVALLLVAGVLWVPLARDAVVQFTGVFPGAPYMTALVFLGVFLSMLQVGAGGRRWVIWGNMLLALIVTPLDLGAIVHDTRFDLLSSASDWLYVGAIAAAAIWSARRFLKWARSGGAAELLVQSPPAT